MIIMLSLLFRARQCIGEGKGKGKGKVGTARNGKRSHSNANIIRSALCAPSPVLFACEGRVSTRAGA